MKSRSRKKNKNLIVILHKLGKKGGMKFSEVSNFDISDHLIGFTKPLKESQSWKIQCVLCWGMWRDHLKCLDNEVVLRKMCQFWNTDGFESYCLSEKFS